jgi:hypothetical protein
MKRLTSLVLSSGLILSAMLASPAIVSAATCKGINANYTYKNQFTLSTVKLTMHVWGCYDGTKAWPTKVQLTSGVNWAVLGKWSSYASPSMEPNPYSGNAFFSAHPVFAQGGGLDYLLGPAVLMSKSGTFTLYDHVAKACQNGSMTFFFNTRPIINSYTWQLGPKNLVASGVPGSCQSQIDAQPVFISSTWSTYTEPAPA